MGNEHLVILTYLTLLASCQPTQLKPQYIHLSHLMSLCLMCKTLRVQLPKPHASTTSGQFPRGSIYERNIDVCTHDLLHAKCIPSCHLIESSKGP